MSDGMRSSHVIHKAVNDKTSRGRLSMTRPARSAVNDKTRGRIMDVRRGVMVFRSSPYFCLVLDVRTSAEVLELFESPCSSTASDEHLLFKSGGQGKAYHSRCWIGNPTNGLVR